MNQFKEDSTVRVLSLYNISDKIRPSNLFVSHFGCKSLHGIGMSDTEMQVGKYDPWHILYIHRLSMRNMLWCQNSPLWFHFIWLQTNKWPAIYLPNSCFSAIATLSLGAECQHTRNPFKLIFWNALLCSDQWIIGEVPSSMIARNKSWNISVSLAMFGSPGQILLWHLYAALFIVI